MSGWRLDEEDGSWYLWTPWNQSLGPLDPGDLVLLRALFTRELDALLLRAVDR